jgi:hypothetical protein
MEQELFEKDVGDFILAPVCKELVSTTKEPGSFLRSIKKL